MPFCDNWCRDRSRIPRRRRQSSRRRQLTILPNFQKNLHEIENFLGRVRPVPGAPNLHLPLLWKGPYTPSASINTTATPAIQFSLKTMELLKNGLQPHSGATPLFSIRAVSQASSQSCCSVDADSWCRHAPRVHLLERESYCSNVSNGTLTTTKKWVRVRKAQNMASYLILTRWPPPLWSSRPWPWVLEVAGVRVRVIKCTQHC